MSNADEEIPRSRSIYIPIHETDSVADLQFKTAGNEHEPSVEIRRIEALRSRIRNRYSSQIQSETPKNENDPLVEKRDEQVEGALAQPKNYDVAPPDTYTGSESTKQRKLVIRLADPIRIKWDLFVMLLAAWNCFATPYEIAFKSGWDDSEVYFSANSVIDLIFFFDMIVNFRTTYYSINTGDEIFNTWEIAKNYLLGKFWIDILSCFPSDLIDLVGENDQPTSLKTVLTLLGLLKLYRISRLNRIINLMRAKNDVKLILRISQLLFFLIMYIHLVSCALWMMVSYDQIWLPPSDGSDIFGADVAYQYWTAFYYGVSMLVGGDIGPRNTIQACFGAFMTVVGAIITAVMFGNMALLMSNLNMRQTKFQENLNAVNTAMKNMRLPDVLQQRISDYLIYTEATMAGREEFEIFQTLISPSLYKQVLVHLYQTIIKENVVFGKNTYITEFILPRLKPLFCKPEEGIILQGEKSEVMSLYFIARGDCEVYIRDEQKRQKHVGILRSGSHFGEVALLTAGNRTASVRALSYTTLGVLDNTSFNQLIMNFPMTLDAFKQVMFAYNDRFKRFLFRMLKRVSVFKALSSETQQEILYSLKETSVEEGEYIVKPGMTTQEILFLKEGVVEVSITINDKQLHKLRASLYNLKSDQEFGRVVNWNLKSAIIDTNLKKITEIFPVVGSTGIEGSVHATALESCINKTKLGRYCVELVLDHLYIGSCIGPFTCLSNERYSIQAKAKTKCSLYSIDKATLTRLRKQHIDLHNELTQFEDWSSENTPYVDDYVVCNDAKPGFLFEMNKMRERYRLRGAILRVIKENRDRQVLKTPLIALMLKNIIDNPRMKEIASKGNTSAMTKAVLQYGFNPNYTGQLLKQQILERASARISTINKKLLIHSYLLQDLSDKIFSIQDHLSRSPLPLPLPPPPPSFPKSVSSSTQTSICLSISRNLSSISISPMNPSLPYLEAADSVEETYRTEPFSPFSSRMP
jgi:CRP-like cAMP-binding protein